MVFKIKLFLAFFVLCGKDAFAFPRFLNASQANDDDGIVGGETIDITQAPYQAHMIADDIYNCGGVIISKRFIVTAGHCLHGISKVTVTIGTSKCEIGGQKYKAESFSTHPKFIKSPKLVDYDVGLVKTDRDMELDGKKSKTIKIADANFIVESGTELFVSGWGDLSEHGPSSIDLQGVKIPALSMEECKALYDSSQIIINDRMICAGLKQGGKGSCHGDSGGPAVAKDTLVGLVSFGVICADARYPGVYTRVANPEINQWIKEVAGI